MNASWCIYSFSPADKNARPVAKSETPNVLKEMPAQDSSSKKYKSAPVTPVNELKPSQNSTPKDLKDSSSSYNNNNSNSSSNSSNSNKSNSDSDPNSSSYSIIGDDDDDDDIPADRRRSSFGRRKHMKLRDMMALGLGSASKSPK